MNKRILTQNDFSDTAIARNETLFTLANGNLGLRGDFEERDACFHKGTYINGFESLVLSQSMYLKAFWDIAAIEIEGDTECEQALYCNLFHLLQSSGKDGKTSIAAKGLTAEGYEGHFFWDTEAYICPVFTYLKPDLAQKLLEYRYAILPQAKKRSQTMALKGALYPWRTINGEETSAYYPAGTAQYHINADIMYALKKYMQSGNNPQFSTFFDGIADISKLPLSKPAPDIFLEAARLVDAWPQNCVGIEDAQAGIDAIRDAGMFSIGIGDVKNADILLSSTKDLDLSQIQKLFF